MLENQARVLILPTSSSYSSFEDEKSSETKPFLSKVLSFDNTIIPTFSSSSSSSSSTRSSITSNNCSNNKKRRRRSPSEASLPQEQSLVEEVEHAASEAFFISRLSFKLFTYLGLGYRWIIRFLALGCYSVLIMPGLLQVAYYYYKSNLIRRGIPYGDQPRNRLDLYIPVNNDGPKPVVAFVTGGAWIIGYKAWGALLGLQLAERDIIVACIDYRNFPQATIGDMVTDASQGISFLCNNIAEYGGDPNRIYLMGQSAGAHIAACTLVKQASKEFVEGGNCSWTVTQLKAYFGLSGGYNLHDLVPHFHNRGLYRSVFLRIMEGEHSLRFFSPELMIQDPSMERAVLHLPPIILFHGTGDYSIPSDSSKKFADCLQRLGARAELILYKEKTHTDLFVQDPLRGGTDDLVRDVASFIHAGDPVALAKDTVIPPRRRLVPEFLLKLATKISPF